MKRYQVFLSLLLVLSLLAGCSRRPAGRAATPTPEKKMASSGTSVVIAETGRSGDGTGLRIRLSEGKEQTEARPLVPRPSSTPLTPAEVQQILNRLPPLPSVVSDTQAFALPKESLPPPRTGKTVTDPFPPPTTPVAPETQASGPLEVLRYAPEGNVALAPYLSVTFSQPMVALTSQEEAAQTVPVRLAPEPSGKWRWLGTKTLLFEPEGRFPMATRYTVEVAAGITSAIGGRLDATVTWNFTTPPPQMQSHYPDGGPQVLDPLMFVAFDQKIDPDAVLPTVKVTAGGTARPIRLATADEIQADETVRRLSESTLEGRWLAFRATEPFPPATQVSVTIGPGTPSAEGPLKTESAQGFGFYTYEPLRVEEHRCSWGQDCPPLTPWYIRFNNPLDGDAFKESFLRVEPEVPGLSINVFGNTISLRGRTQGRTTYKVTLSAAIQDRFGQTLGKDQTLTFTTGSSPSAISVPGGPFVVLDPSAKPTYSVFTINYKSLNVQAYAVQPEDWTAFQTYLRERNRRENPPTPPGRRVLNKSIPINGKADELTETAIDLSPALTNSLGHLVVIVEPTGGIPIEGQQPRRVVVAWVQATRIGLDAFVDQSNMVAWANSLLTGAPLSGVNLNLYPGGPIATTDAQGVARLPLPSTTYATLLVARQGQDVAILPRDLYWWGDGGWRRQEMRDDLRWYVFDDRQMYRPGEEVHIKGWLRLVGSGPTGDVGPLQGAVERLRYRLTDPQGNNLLDGVVPINAMGGFDTVLKLPQPMNLGYASLLLTAEGVGFLNGREYVHRFQVQEFRRPEFEVTASVSEGPHIVGGHAIASVTALYYAGGALANADVTWEVRSSPGYFTPPNWDDFTFGSWIPWWYIWREPDRGQEQVLTYKGYTDAAGAHYLRLDFEAVDPPRPMNVNAQGTVMDVNRQAWTASANMLVHPASLYVGLRTERYFVRQGEPMKVEAIVVNLDGVPIPGRTIALRAARLEWKYKNGSWQEVEADAQDCAVQSAEKPVLCTFATPEGGTYRITATITDDQGRKNRTEMTRWVSGGSRPPARKVEQEEATLVPDRKEYQPGDTAEILVMSPFYPAEGVVTLRRSGLVSTQRFTMEGPSYTLRIPIEEAYIPNVNVQVDLVGAATRTTDSGEEDTRLPKRPAFATGSLNLPVPPLARKLSLEVTPRDKALDPGGETVLDITLKDAAGRPVQGGELAVVVVDEAVLSLTGYRLPDPIAVFYSQRSAGVSDYHLRASIILASPDQLLAEGEAGLAQDLAMVPEAPRAAMPTAVMEKAVTEERQSAAEPIRVRLDFNALATFAPAVPTDDQGRAQVTVKLPDNLTRYRVMVVAVAGGKQFGMGESAITARLPLMVRPSPPRFLNFGDRFELPVVLQNQTDAPLMVDVAVRATNAQLTGDVGRRVTIPANDRAEVRFPVATLSAGTARFQVGAVSGPYADATQFELPVWTPATTEAFATYGEIDTGAVVQPIIAPSNVFTQFGGLEISTSSTALQALTDAVLYLVSYPFECSEQIASRILAVAALRDVLTAFKAEGLPSPEEMLAAVARDVEKLQGMQNDDGGFPIWRKGYESWPYLSVHVIHALQRAKEKGFVVPPQMLARGQQYLKDIRNHIPPDYGEQARWTITAYALYVRDLMGDRDTAAARALIKEATLTKLSPEAVGWLLSVLTDDPNSASEVNAIRRYLVNRVTETAGAASFTTSYSDNDAYVLLHSSRRTDAIILDALMADQPQSDLIPKLVRGLLAHRTQGRWSNTQENAFVLLALDRYFNTYEAQTPDFVARAWLGEQYAGGHEFKGRTTDRHEIRVPMSYLKDSTGEQDLILSKEGVGRLYYRLGLRYAPTDLQLQPADYGFTVERTYEAIDSPEDVSRDENGVWHIVAGARVRVRLTMVATSRRYHVALVDPLPAGFEALNPALAVTGSIPRDEKGSEGRGSWWWWSTWYQHQNLRDERAEAFTPLLWEGVYTYSYVARATTPGEFIVPPAKAEEMYAPETFGRSGTDRVIVE